MIKTRYIRCFFVVLVSFLVVVVYGEESTAYQDTLRSIDLRIKQAYLSDDFDMIAQGHFDRAMHNYSVHLRDQDVINDLIKSAKGYRYIRDEGGFYKARMALASFYIDEEIFLGEALKLTAEAYKFYSERGEDHKKAKAVTQLGRGHQKKLDYEKALVYVEEGLKLSIELEDKRLELTNRLMIVKLLGNLGKVETLVEQGKYVVDASEQLDYLDIAAEANYLIGSTLVMDEQNKEALPYLKEAVRLNTAINDLSLQSNDLLSRLYVKLNKVDLAYHHLQSANTITTQLYNQEKYATANQIAVQYQTYEKEKEIRELEEQNELSAFKLTQRTRFFIVLSVFLAMAAFAAFNYYRLQKHRYDSEKTLSAQKAEISKQKINELENSLKIKNLQSVVRGQEAERTRIATDLHDSLGGMLSTLKLQYDTLQVDHQELGEDSDYHKIMGLIDDACTDVRDIARNLKPNALEKLGLTAALRDLVNRYRIKGVLDIELNVGTVDNLLDDERTLHVYRIIQELLNNALKHAEATDIDVNVSKIENELVVMVEDNGKGFDRHTVQKGLGLGNLESRVNVLKGEMEIDSSLARGTSVIVHIPLSEIFAQTPETVQA